MEVGNILEDVLVKVVVVMLDKGGLELYSLQL